MDSTNTFDETPLRNKMFQEIAPTGVFRSTCLFHCLSSHSVRAFLRFLRAPRLPHIFVAHIHVVLKFYKTSNKHYCSSITAIIRFHCRYSTTQRHSYWHHPTNRGRCWHTTTRSPTWFKKQIRTPPVLLMAVFEHALMIHEHWENIRSHQSALIPILNTVKHKICSKCPSTTLACDWKRDRNKRTFYRIFNHQLH